MKCFKVVMKESTMSYNLFSVHYFFPINKNCVPNALSKYKTVLLLKLDDVPGVRRKARRKD